MFMLFSKFQEIVYHKPVDYIVIFIAKENHVFEQNKLALILLRCLNMAIFNYYIILLCFDMTLISAIIAIILPLYCVIHPLYIFSLFIKTFFNGKNNFFSIMIPYIIQQSPSYKAPPKTTPLIESDFRHKDSKILLNCSSHERPSLLYDHFSISGRLLQSNIMKTYLDQNLYVYHYKPMETIPIIDQYTIEINSPK